MAEQLDSNLEALVTRPREDLHIEIKNWVDLTDPAGKATLAKAIIALANHGGGFVVIGLAELDDGTFAPADNRPPNLTPYSQDAVNGIVQAYAAPAFHCAVHHLDHPATGDRFPVIQVPGGHRVPVQAIKGSPDQRTLVNGKYYIRRQGPQSAEPATAEEWRDLVMRCVRAGRDDLLVAIRDVLAGHAPEASSAPTILEDLQEWASPGIEKWQSLVPGDQYGNPAVPRGFYCVAYAIDGSFERPSLVELSSILKLSMIQHTGWPAWWLPTMPDIEPYPIDGMLECDMGVASGRLLSDPQHADFWRASLYGRLLLIRGLLEDNLEGIEPGQIFSLTTPIWRAGECLLHAAAVATNRGGSRGERRLYDEVVRSARSGIARRGTTPRRPRRACSPTGRDRAEHHHPRRLD